MLERERQFRAVFFDAADAMLILDDDRVILEANPSACALFGVPEEAITGESLDALLVDGEEELAAAWRELMALGEARREHRVRSRAAGADARGWSSAAIAPASTASGTCASPATSPIAG